MRLSVWCVVGIVSNLLVITCTAQIPSDSEVKGELLCYACKEEYPIRREVHYLPAEVFTRDGLKMFFEQRFKRNDVDRELYVYVFCDREEIKEFLAPRYTISGRGVDVESVLALYQSKSGFAQGYRMNDSEVFWYQLPNDPRGSGSVILKGEDPFYMTGVPFPFVVVVNQISVGDDGVRCLDRELRVLVRPCDWSEDKLSLLFRVLARRFDVPERLTVIVHFISEEARRELINATRVEAAMSLKLRGGALPECPVSDREDTRTRKSAIYSRSPGESFFYYSDLGTGLVKKVQVPR